MVELPIRHPELFAQLGIDPPKGILFHGPPGSGKTLIARAVAHEAGCHFISVNGPEVIRQHYGESEAYLRNIFETAQEYPASIIFLDEIDAIAPNRETVLGDVEKRVVAQLLSLMDGLNARGQVIVIAATNLPNSIDPALRRPGRFDREISIGPPDHAGRREILSIHTRTMPLGPDVDLARLAEITHGFLGADIAALCREAAMLCARDAVKTLALNYAGQFEQALRETRVEMRHFEQAQKEIDLSTTRQVSADTPNVKWSDVGGLEDIRGELRDVVEYPLRYGDRFEQLATRPPTGVLLTGAPGTGKTLVAKALAAESGINFISVKGPELLSKWVGDSEKGIRDIFKTARQAAPAIVFIDEIDAIAPIRGRSEGAAHISERMVGQLLLEMDGVNELGNLIILAATNRPDLIDPALLRPGRFDLVLQLPIPDERARRSILQVHCRHRSLAPDVSIDQLAHMTEGLSGAELEALCRRASMLAIRQSIAAEPGPNHRPIEVAAMHFSDALRTTRIRRDGVHGTRSAVLSVQG
jgi:transitional endoplasmic reticulum ATPase